MPCLRWFATNHQFIGNARTKPARRDIDMMNQKLGPSGFRLSGVTFIGRVITTVIPAIRKFMDNSSDRKVMRKER